MIGGRGEQGEAWGTSPSMDAAAHTAMPKMQFSYKIRKEHKEIDE